MLDTTTDSNSQSMFSFEQSIKMAAAVDRLRKALASSDLPSPQAIAARWKEASKNLRPARHH